MIGKIKWFNEKKGFGFIEGENGDVFVHITVLQKCGVTLPVSEGDEVAFEAKKREKGLQATSVEIIRKA